LGPALLTDAGRGGIGRVLVSAEPVVASGSFLARRLFRKEGFMAQTAAASRMTGKPLIESDRVEGTTAYDPSGKKIGSIKRLMIDKMSGKVAYAVMSFGGFLGMGEEEHTIPWNKLDYDTDLGGYRTDITEEQLRGAPTFYRERDYEWSDRTRERQLHDYWRAPYYWGVGV